MSQRDKAATAHAQRVARTSQAVNKFYEQNLSFRIFHGSSNSTCAAARRDVVDISDLKHIISINQVKKTALIEPGIPTDELVKYLLRHNLMPAVVPELPGITTGGAFAGTAAESSSFRYGYLDRNVSSVEIVLGNEDINQASPLETAGLFFGSAGALGTLSITTLLEVQLVECDRLIEVTYTPVASHAQALQLFEGVGEDVDFINGIMVSGSHGVVVEGRLVEEHDKALPIVRFTRTKDPWFFTHVHRKLRCEPSSDKHLCLTCHWT
jgi:delta24-sterol reductase